MTVTLTMAERGELIIECRGLIVKLAVNFWRQSAAETKAWTTPDDFIEDCYLQLLTAFAEYDGTYSPTTFVWRVLSNYLGDKQKFRHRKGRDVVEMASGSNDVGSGPDAEIRLLVLREAMEHLYSMASPGKVCSTGSLMRRPASTSNSVCSESAQMSFAVWLCVVV